MIISAIDKQNNFALRWREDGKRKEKLIPYNDFQPYFYILEDDKEYSKAEIRDGRSKFTIKVEYIKDGSVNLNGDKLKKVTWTPPKPGYTRTLRELWNETFEADVPFHYRYSIDKLTKIPEYDLVKWYWDLEWQQGGKHDGAITCISLTTNYPLTGWGKNNDVISASKVYAWFPNFYETGIAGTLNDTFASEEDVPKNWDIFTSENSMLVSFIHDMRRSDPDMLISWFGSKFDLPKLIERIHANGLDPRAISPYNDVKGVYWNDGVKLSKQAKGYSPIDQPIRGRLILNLDLAFERQWNDAQRGTLPSLALDYVAELVLGEKKLVSEKFPDKNEFFQRAWLEDTKTYLEYALKDTDLLKRIDEENYTSEAIIALQRLLIAPFDACFYASNMASIYFMRNASWKAPTGKREEKQHYKGAMIYEPSKEGTNGLHMGVAAFDFAGLYPSMMIARNISWETKSLHPTEFAVNLLTPRDFSDSGGWGEVDMRYYKTNELGLLPKAVLELKDLRDIYKKHMRDATSDAEYVKWNNNQMAVKRLMASFYGIIGYQGFGWADVDLAASITASAREAIRSVAFKVMEL